jgi:histidine triad (HIT) family protein
MLSEDRHSMKNSMTGIKKDRLLYEDEVAFAVFAERPSALGHVKVFPQRDVMNVEELSDDEASHLFFVASFSATAVFEGLGAHGTNIIAQSGSSAGNEHGRLCIHILPRKQDDGLSFSWKPLKLSDDEQNIMQEKIKDQTFYIGKAAEDNKKKNAPVFGQHDGKASNTIETDDYLSKQLDRVP